MWKILIKVTKNVVENIIYWKKRLHKLEI